MTNETNSMQKIVSLMHEFLGKIERGEYSKEEIQACINVIAHSGFQEFWITSLSMVAYQRNSLEFVPKLLGQTTSFESTTNLDFESGKHY